MGEAKRRRVVGYKHVAPDFADRFATGESILVGTFAYYQTFESPRRDVHEGLTVHKTGKLTRSHFLDPKHQAARNVIEPVVGDISRFSNMNFIMHDNTFIAHHPPAYLFCCSDRPDEELKSSGQVVFEILDLVRFAKILRRARLDRLGAIRIAPVNYGSREADPFRPEGPLASGPFEKSDLYRHENEIRIVWDTQTDDEPRLFLNAPNAAKLIRRLP